MSDFSIYAETGLYHGLDVNSYLLILFLVMLAIPYSIKDWKRVLLLAAIFSIGCLLSLLLSSFGIAVIKSKVVAFLIPITLLITAVYNIFSAGKSSRKDAINIIGFILFFFGIVHGLGFSESFAAVFSGGPSGKLIPLLAFAIGIEGAIITILLLILILTYIIHTFFRLSKRDFIVVLSAFIMGVVVPVIIGNEIWK